MYSFSSKIKLTALISMIVGLIAIIYGFIATPSSVADLQHGGEAAHDPAHLEHVLHLLQNKPWAALYVAALFFLLISLGVLAFYAINRSGRLGSYPL